MASDKCPAELHIADNFGDNHATMRCDLEPGHEGQHTETWTTAGDGSATVVWVGDHRETEMRCSTCGETASGPERWIGGECVSTNDCPGPMVALNAQKES